jgi:hypothetical protein
MGVSLGAVVTGRRRGRRVMGVTGWVATVDLGDGRPAGVPTGSEGGRSVEGAGGSGGGVAAECPEMGLGSIGNSASSGNMSRSISRLESAR